MQAKSSSATGPAGANNAAAAPKALPIAACPSCRKPMTVLKLTSRQDLPLELDLCFDCHGIWVDGTESQQLAPQAIIALFKALHEHKDDPTHALKSRMACPRCRSELTRSMDRTRSGEYTVYRCASQRHGRFSTFASFMVEKGFVRHLNPMEVRQLAAEVKQIQCSGCGASVDLKNHDRCGHCGAAFAFLDPNAVAEALAHFAQQADRRVAAQDAAKSLAEGSTPTAATARNTVDAYAQIAIERERERERARREGKDTVFSSPDLWEVGLRVVGELLRRW